MNWRIILLFAFFGLASCTSNDPDKKIWIKLFNGKDLTGWKAKITHHEFGENFGNTFRVEDSVLKVKYDQYDSFRMQFGHLFYETKYSHYLLVVEYRFVGEQCPGAPEW